MLNYNSKLKPEAMLFFFNNMYLELTLASIILTQGFCKDCRYTIHSDSGEIRSPNFPIEYPANILCTWDISSVNGENLSLYFDVFDIEFDAKCERDGLIISFGGPRQVKACGTAICGKTLISQSDFFHLVFHTDGDNREHHNGFHAIFNAVSTTTDIKQTTIDDSKATRTTLSPEVSSMDTAKPTKTRVYTVTAPVLDTGTQPSSKNQNLTTALMTVSIFSIVAIACLSIFIYIEIRGRPSIIIQNLRKCNKKKVPGNQKDDNMSRTDSQFSDLQSVNNQRNDGSVLQPRTRDYETLRQSNIVDDQQYEVLRHGSVPEYSNTNQIL